MRKDSVNVLVTKTADEIPSPEVAANEQHKLNIQIDSNNNVSFDFSSRLALYDFARSLLNEAIFGEQGEVEFYPLDIGGELLVVNGVRLDKSSERLFLSYPNNDASMPL